MYRNQQYQNKYEKQNSRFKNKTILRKANGISLTEYGKKLFDITSGINDIHEQAINLLGSAKNLTSGTLRIGTVAPVHLMGLVKIFIKISKGKFINFIWKF